MAYNYGNDIGYLGNTPGIQPVYNNIKRNQVYQATHNSNDERTSYNARSYISFSFGGTQIEDLNLIACIDGDRMERQLTANFHDLTSSYDVVDGQFYWGTYYDNNQMNFYLATDGMTQENLEDFIRLFAPGSTRELILAEHPNRAIMARVATPPIMNVIPFQEEVDFKVNTINRTTITALYKGDIRLELIMDEPFWYSKINLLGQLKDDKWIDNWIDANKKESVVFNNQDALRIILEDRIPTLSMLRAPLFLGNNLLFYYNIDNTQADYAIADKSKLGVIRTAIAQIGTALDLDSGASVYLYYSGTAPEKPIISFSIQSRLEDLINLDETNINKFIDIDFYCQGKQKLILKLPMIYQQYKQVKTAFEQWNSTDNTYRDIRIFIRTNITHPVIKKWSLYIVDYCQGKGYSLNSQGITYLPLLFTFFNEEEEYTSDGSESILVQEKLNNKYYLNFQTGELTCEFQYRNVEDLSSLSNIESFLQENFSVITVKENIGNILMSKPIILKDRNHPSSNGKIKFYKTENDDATLSYKIINNSLVKLNQLSIEFSNRYY